MALRKCYMIRVCSMSRLLTHVHIILNPKQQMMRSGFSLIVCMYALGMCVLCLFSSHIFWTSSSLDVLPAGVTQEEGHTGFLTHLPSAVSASIFHARRIQPFLSLVDRKVGFCVLII